MFGFVVDTDQYAGNFERELVAWMTGCIGECSVGAEMVEEHIKKKFETNIFWKSDDNGCRRPAEAVMGPKGVYNSVAAYFDERPNQNEINLMKARAATFNEEFKKRDSWYKQYPDTWEGFNILGFRVVEYKKDEVSEDV